MEQLTNGEALKDILKCNEELTNGEVLKNILKCNNVQLSLILDKLCVISDCSNCWFGNNKPDYFHGYCMNWFINEPCDYQKKTEERGVNLSKIYLFTHTDLDGIGCATVMSYYSKLTKTPLSITYCEYSDVNEQVKNFINSIVDGRLPREWVDSIWITDISVSEEVADCLNELAEKENISLHLLDHHKTAEWLNKYSWAWVDSSYNVCGTVLVADKLCEIGSMNSTRLNSFANDVCLYDTWRFNKEELDNPVMLNYLAYTFTRDDFIETMIHILDSNPDKEFKLPEVLRLVAYGLDMRMKEYVETVKEKSSCGWFKKWKVRWAFASKYPSQVGHALATFDSTYDFAMVVDMENGSIHLRGAKDSVDLGVDIAKPMGGGGHKAAAAFSIPSDEDGFNNFIEFIRTGVWGSHGDNT